MAQRAEVKPRLIALATKIAEVEGGSLDLPALFEHAEDEVVEVVRASITMPPSLDWNDLIWLEDIPTLAQAIWEVCITGDGALLGKLTRALTALSTRAK